ncbi:hypothetical protein SAMN04488065_0612 [Haloplanus vescus]|uniref:Uncharacterized protein n=1 Tax=Haloplanus vescus TaxID=555874 RepID=A0A1H3W8N4_9EURY|nr:hypothetical protein [Haloplanus vescus]SDZ82784.1 hypothetical protein SAMN04488065_0612 [Haloplanus vescus]
MGIPNAALYGSVGGLAGLAGVYITYANPDWFLAVLPVMLLAVALYMYQLEPVVSDGPMQG